MARVLKLLPLQMRLQARLRPLACELLWVGLKQYLFPTRAWAERCRGRQRRRRRGRQRQQRRGRRHLARHLMRPRTPDVEKMY